MLEDLQFTGASCTELALRALLRGCRNLRRLSVNHRESPGNRLLAYVECGARIEDLALRNALPGAFAQ